ncbi:restriction endonuclease subunit S [Flavobacterium davisii]|nr:restriction endonuclease subunit S [Flavobacterium davisii]
MQNLKYITFVPFANFNLWDTKRYTSKLISSTFPIVSLDNCIVEQNKKYKIFEDLETDFGILGVNNKEGIFDAYTQKGKEINQPYKKMETGWLAYNPYRINVGSIGIKLKEHKNEYISPAYVVFSCNENLLPEFLFFLFKTSVFNTVINESTTGSVRQNLTFETLKGLQIPLPSIEEQNKIVTSYNAKLQLAQQQEEQAKTLETEIEKYLFKELCIRINTNKGIKKGLHTINYSSVEKWSLDDIFKKNVIISDKYNLVNLNSVCSLITDGTHQTPKYFDKGIVFLSAKNVTKEVIDWENIKYVSKEAHIEYTKRVKPEVGDILLAKNGTTGVGAIVDIEKDFSIYVSLALLKPIKSLINPLYLLFIINSEIARTQFFSRLIGIGVPNLHLGEIKEVIIPLPPLEIQTKIINTINSIKAQINELNVLSAKNKEEAIVEFEKEIFI